MLRFVVAVVVAFVCPILETYSFPILETVVSPSLATFSTLAAAIVVECVELPRCREAKPVFWLNGERVHLKHGSIFLIDRCSCHEVGVCKGDCEMRIHMSSNEVSVPLMSDFISLLSVGMSSNFDLMLINVDSVFDHVCTERNKDMFTNISMVHRSLVYPAKLRKSPDAIVFIFARMSLIAS